MTMTKAPELHELLARRDDVLERRALLDEDARELAEQIDAHRLAHRPTYPGPEAREGLRLIVGRVKDGTVSGSHHGDTIDTEGPAYLVHAWGSQAGRYGGGDTHYISLRHDAPYPLGRGVARLWTFAPAEVEAFRRMLAEEGFLIVKDWSHDGGHAFTVTYDPTWEPIRDALAAAETRFDRAVLELQWDGIGDKMTIASETLSIVIRAVTRNFAEAAAQVARWVQGMSR